MKWFVLPLLVSVPALFTACGPSSSRPFTGGDDTGIDAAGVGSGSNTNTDGCSDAAKLVYVVDENNKLSQFDPTTKTFHDLGSLNCPAQSGAMPFSMGVDRTATAWVLYDSGEVFHVDTSSLACTKTTWTQQLGLAEFGMGFSTDTVGGTTDTLFVAGGANVQTLTTATLATIDMTSMHAMSVGSVSGSPELTGNGNAELWGFFPDTSQPKVEKLNKLTGHADQTFNENSLAGMPMAWAFAFYGGDYWVFLMKDFETATTVYQIDGSTGAVKGMTNTGTRVIVGAGVSTCAPVVIF